MYNRGQRFIYASLAIFLFMGVNVLAQRPYRVNDRQVEQVLRRIENRSNTFRSQLSRALDRSNLNGTQYEDEVNRYVQDFENATDQLKSRFNDRQDVTSNVQEVLSRASFIDSFMRRYQLANNAENSWNKLRSDLNILARYYNVSWNWNNPPYYPPSRVDDRQVAQLLRMIESRSNGFKSQLERALDRSSLNGTKYEDEVNQYVSNFENATDQLKNRFNDRQDVTSYVQSVLTRASYIDTFMRTHRLNVQTEKSWSSLRSDLDTLARYYNVGWNWDNKSDYPPVYPPNSGVYDLTGTYRIDYSQSDNIQTIAERETRNLNYSQRQKVRSEILRRLATPDNVAIERQGRVVTIASTLAPKMTFEADGRTHYEQTPRGNVSVTANLNGDAVTINLTGNNGNDFYANIDPFDNGKRLQITRRIYVDELRRNISVNSYYTKTSDVAQFNIFRGYPGDSDTGAFIVPGDTIINATLNQDLNTKTVKEGDTFTATVNSPSQYYGAVIKGHVSQVKSSGRLLGRSEMTLNFDTIRLRNGNEYRFAGLVETVRTTDGETIDVNNEGVVEDGNQTKKTITRTSIGAALGAIIGAIAGGGEGAAIGAAIGAGAGAGSVLIQGRENIELKSGTEFSIRSTSPSTNAIK